MLIPNESFMQISDNFSADHAHREMRLAHPMIN